MCKVICVKCIESFNTQPNGDGEWRCHASKNTVTTDNVTGERTYLDYAPVDRTGRVGSSEKWRLCSVINTAGECCLYESKEEKE